MKSLLGSIDPETQMERILCTMINNHRRCLSVSIHFPCERQAETSVSKHGSLARAVHVIEAGVHYSARILQAMNSPSSGERIQVLLLDMRTLLAMTRNPKR